MNLHLIEFRGAPGKGRRVPKKRVTLSTKSAIYLSGGALEMLGNPKALRLSYDPHKQIIGLSPSEPGRTNAFTLIQREGHAGQFILARPFCKHFDIKILRTIAFNQINVDPETGTMLLDLTDTTLTGREPGSLKEKAAK